MGLWIAALSRGMASKENLAMENPEEELQKPESEYISEPELGKKGAPREMYLKTYITSIVIGVLSLVVIGVMSAKYEQLKQARKPLDQPFRELRSSLATAAAEPELLHIEYEKVAEELVWLKGKTAEAEMAYDERKQKYRALFNKTRRGFSGPWKFFSNGLYYFSKGEKSWYDAENFCISRGAHLASIRNFKEQSFITSELQEASWIGLTNENMDGKWRWSDGSSVVTQYWSEGQPRNTELFVESNQDCAFMVPSPTKNNWNDDNCHRPYRWVCKENLDLREL